MIKLRGRPLGSVITYLPTEQGVPCSISGSANGESFHNLRDWVYQYPSSIVCPMLSSEEALALCWPQVKIGPPTVSYSYKWSIDTIHIKYQIVEKLSTESHPLLDSPVIQQMPKWRYKIISASLIQVCWILTLLITPSISQSCIPNSPDRFRTFFSIYVGRACWTMGTCTYLPILALQKGCLVNNVKFTFRNLLLKICNFLKGDRDFL